MAEERKFTRQEPIEDEVAKISGKRKRRPTACADKKRGSLTCGICGSGNIARHGVAFCTICEMEEPFTILAQDHFYKNQSEIKYPDCRCVSEYKWHRSNFDAISVKACMDCGAVEGPRCPVCKNKMWAKGDRRFCKGYCGYRR